MIEPWVVVVAGGRSTRFGSDKLTLVLDRTLAGLPARWPVIAVGPRRATMRHVTWVREDPPLGGPLAAVGAGIGAVPAEVDPVLVVAGDMPGAGAAVAALIDACSDGVDAATVLDAAGYRQPLLACYRAAPLRRTLARLVPLADRPARLLLDGLAIADVPDRWNAAHDVDTPADLT